MSIKTITLISLTFMLPSFNVSAEGLVFKCEMKNNKQVKLYKSLNEITYSFGKNGSPPNIELKRKKEEIEVVIDNQSGRYLTNSIKINNGDYSYQLTTNVDKIANEQIPKTSLTVMKNGEDLTSFECIKGSEIGTLIAIDD